MKVATFNNPDQARRAAADALSPTGGFAAPEGIEVSELPPPAIGAEEDARSSIEQALAAAKQAWDEAI